MSATFSDHLRIVVADDERDVRQYLSEVLTHLGHHVQTAEERPRADRQMPGRASGTW